MSFTYRGLKAELVRHIVTEEEVNKHMERLRQQNPKIAVIKDRPTQLGDEVVLDYAGFCNGEQFAGGTAQNQTLVLGSGTFIPGFEEQLVDKVPEEKVIVRVKFPTQYHADGLADKEAEFHCTIHEIREKTTHQLDDDFAKDVGHCETYAQMREMLQKSLQSYADERGEMDMQDRLLRQAAETLETPVSEKDLQEAVDNQINSMKAQLARQNLTLEMYCQFMNTSEEALREDALPAAKTAVQCQAAIDKIVELEVIEATEEEFNKACMGVCKQNNLTMEQMQKYMDREFEMAIIRSILASKAMAFIREHAEVTETTDA